MREQPGQGDHIPLITQYADESGETRRRALGSHAPALTVIIAGIYDEAWLLEIEAIAAG